MSFGTKKLCKILFWIIERLWKMKEFKSVHSYQNFASEVRHNKRFIRSQESQDFLETILETCRSRISREASGGALWRAQLGNDWRPEGEGEEKFEVHCAYMPKRMKPIPEKTGDGRINPRQISYLYMATDVETAIAEVRPWVGAYVSVGMFELCCDLKLIDCTKDVAKGTILYSKEPVPEKREKKAWSDINSAFSFPVGPTDDYAAYVPTQIIAELFRDTGFDGIIYRSSLGSGKNVCLFDLNVAKMTYGTLFQVKDVKYNISEEEYARYSVSS